MPLPRRRLQIAVLLAVLLSALPAARPALAQNFVVTQTGDTDDGNPGGCGGDGCTLREAIRLANSSPGPHTISFNIPGNGPHEITPSRSLPALTANDTTIDGTNQATGQIHQIAISGVGLTVGHGLLIRGSNNEIRNLVIGDLPAGDADISGGSAIFIDGTNGGDNNRIYNNRLGLSPRTATGIGGDQARNNGRYGVRVGLGANNNRIGGTGPNQGNVIAGGGIANIGIGGAGEISTNSGNIIAGNQIGLNLAGTGKPSGVNDSTVGGISVNEGAVDTLIDGNVIGGMSPGATANERIAGILVAGLGSVLATDGIPTGTTIVRNRIGVNAAGALVPNRSGVRIGAEGGFGPFNTTVGNPSDPAGGRNIIAGNNSNGIEILETGFKYGNVVIAGNLIGINPDGGPAPNGSSPGVGGSDGIRVGRYDPGAEGPNPQVTIGPGNVISSNAGFGIRFRSGGHIVRGNFLGTNLAGASSELPLTNPSFSLRTANGAASIFIENGNGITIGGPTAADRNVIAFSASGGGGVGAGILINPVAASANNCRNAPCVTGGHTIRGNYIGVRADGSAALNSSTADWFSREGIRIFRSVDNTISDNVISGVGVGITVGGVRTAGANVEVFAADRTTISGNRIGTRASGDTSTATSGIGNSREGILVLAGSGTAISNNLIAYNGRASNVAISHGGVLVGSANQPVAGTTLTSNRLVRNGNVGSGNGVEVDGVNGVRISRTETSLNAADGISLFNNGNQNRVAPSISAVAAGSPPVASGSVANCDGCEVEIFASTVSEPGEGPVYIARGSVSGSSFNIPVPGCLRYLTATVTDGGNNTSPFSAVFDSGAAGPCVATAPPTLDPASPNSRSITPGSSTTYVHRLSHSVQAERTYAIQISSSQGWARGPAFVTVPAAPAGGTSSTTFEVVVSVPAAAPAGTQDVTRVRAFSGALSSQEQTNTTTAQPEVVLPAAPDVSPGQRQPYQPGGVTFTHSVTNTGTLAGTFQVVNPQLVNPPAGFSIASATIAQPNLGGGQSTTLTIVVSTPATPPPPGEIALRFAVGVVNGQQTAVVENRIVVTAVRSFSFTPEAAQQGSTPAGGTVSFDYVLTNTGNAPDSFSVSGAPAGNGNPLTFVSAVVTGPGATNSLSNLAPGASANVRVTFRAPSGAAVASWGVTVTAQGAAGANPPAAITRNATVAITGGGAATIQAGQGSPDPVDVRTSAQTVTFVNSVTNSGNAAVPIVVPASFAAPNGLTASVTANSCDDTATIAPGASCSFTVQVSVPQGLDAGSYNVRVTATADNSAIQPPAQSVTAEAVNVVNVERFRGVEIGPDRTLTGAPREVLTFTHILTNTGNGTDSFSLTASATLPGWSVLITPTELIDVPRGATRNVTVTAVVPVGVLAGASNTITVLAAARGGSESDTATNTAVAATITAADLSNGTRRNVDAGRTVTYTHALTNTGTTRTAFSVTSEDSQPGWSSTVSGSPTVQLDPGQSASLSVAVTAPADATTGITNTTTLRAFAAGTSSPVLDTSQNVTVVGPAFGVLLAPDNTGTVLPGNTTTFTHTLTNIGTTQGLFSLTAAEANGWPTTVTPNLVNLGPGQSLTVEVQVLVPEGVRADAVGRSSGFARVRAQLVADPAISDDATNILTVGQVFGVDLSASQARRVTAGGAPQGLGNLVVNNRGNLLDTYDLVAVGVPQGWRVRITPSTVQVDKDSAFRVNVDVTVPEGIERGTQRITIEARSRNNSGARDSIELALLYDPTVRSFVYLPLVRQQGGAR